MLHPLVHLRKAHNLSQGDLAGITKFSVASISHYEIGLKPPSEKFINALKRVFQIDDKELLGGHDKFVKARLRRIKKKLGA